MTIDVREILWNSACTLATHIALIRASDLSAPPELEQKLNGGAQPQVGRYYCRVATATPLAATARILDMGCGYGRIALELAPQLRPGQRYVGIDPNAEAIDWARNAIGALYQNVSFEWVDLRSGPYNPDGALSGREFRFPFEDGSLDLIFMISVLTHVDLPTAENYIREASRTLNPDTGRLIATAFLLDEETEAQIADGQSRYSFPWPHGASRVEVRDEPERVIAHPRHAVLAAFQDAGFAQVSVFNGDWSGRVAPPMDFQDLLMADLSAGRAHQHPPPDIPLPPIETDLFPSTTMDRLERLGFGSRNALMEFIMWSATLTINAIWWRQRGLNLAITSENREEAKRLELNLDALGKLKIEKKTPKDSPEGDIFIHLKENDIIDLLIQSKNTMNKYDILSCMIDVAENGWSVVNATTTGRGLVLISGGVEFALIPAVVTHDINTLLKRRDLLP